MTVNLTMTQANQTVTTLPAKFVEMTYTTIPSAPDETRRGYFILTATNATAPNLGVTKEYSIFYEGNSNDSAYGSATPEITRTTAAAATGSLVSIPLPLSVKQAFDSFELIVAPEVEQAIIQQQSQVGQTGGGLTTTTTTTTTNGGGTQVGTGCDFSYPDNCIPPPPPNLNYVDVGITNFRVLSPDPHDFDRDYDGIGCESGSGVPDGGSEEPEPTPEPEPEPEPEPDDGGSEEGGGDEGEGGGDIDGA